MSLRRPNGPQAKRTGKEVHMTAGATVETKVLVSQTVKDLVAGSGLSFADSGRHELKGVPGEWHLFSVAEQSS
jgi:class 3 adenylate cyclase